MRKWNTVKINKFFVFSVVFLFVLIIFKLVVVGTFKEVDGINIKEFATSRDTVKKKLTASRGDIRDRNGEVLAQNVNSYTVIAYLSPSRTNDKDKPAHVVDKKMTAEKLSPLINMSVDKIMKLLNSESYQVELGPGGRGITELVKEKIEALELPGIDFIASVKRYYPYGDFMSYTIGYAKENNKNEIVGEFGSELEYDEVLTGSNGYMEYQQDVYGYQIANTPAIIKEPVNGKDVYLTLDVNIQMFLEQAISKFKEYGVEWATFTAADAKTGEILGTASSPSFNPNIKNITNYHDPLVSYAYEPGSTMKIFSFMSAMENGVYKGSDTYRSGTLEIDGAKIKDWNKVGWGTISYDNGFLASSNVAATNLGFKIGKTKLLESYKNLGFGSRTNVGLPNEFSGKVNFKYRTEIANASFGQGILTTPIQNIQALTAVSNDGVLLKPFVVSKIVDSETGEVVKENKRKELRTVASKETIGKIKNLMEGVVSGNPAYATGTGYSIPKYHVIGKTGTAEIAAAGGGYLSGKLDYVKSFAGIFPKDDPQIILYVSVSKLQKSGGALSEVVKETIEDIGKYINVAPEAKTTDILEYKIPSFINRSTEEVKGTLKSNKMDVIVIGDGNKVIDQFPKKGSVLNLGSKVFLLTNSTNYKMPDFTGYSSGEIADFGNLIGLNFDFEGYGFCTSQSVKAGSDIKVEDKVKVVMKPKYVKK